jgi:hypothetical protein
MKTVGAPELRVGATLQANTSQRFVVVFVLAPFQAAHR